MSQMLKSSGAMGIATLISRFLGMAREMCYARFMGDGWVASAFVLAFMIPNLFRRLLGEGALTAAFIPLFKEKERTEGEAEMWRSANAVISWLIVVASAIIGIVLIGVSITLAAAELERETRLMLELLRIMFPYMLFVCLTAALMGMLNARGYFFIPAMGATTLNIVMICAVLFVAPHFGHSLETQIFGLAVCVIVAGVAQAAFQIPALHSQGFRYRWITPWSDPTVKTMVKRMIPGTLGVAALQINLLLTQGIAYSIDAPIVASFNYAVRLMELPQGVFGISLAIFLLPTLAGLAAEKNHSEFRATLSKGLDHLIYVNLVISVMLMVLAEPIVRLLFERGQFTAESTERAAFALICLAPGLVAYSAVAILARAYFALGDTKTPMKISVFCLGLNLVLVLAFIKTFRQGGLGMANSITAVLNALLLQYYLRRKVVGFDLREIRRSVLPVVLAATVAGVIAWQISIGLETFPNMTGFWANMGHVFLPLGAASFAYWGMTMAMKVESAREMTALLFRKLGGGKPQS